MRLLDRYLLREVLIPFGYCLSGFLIFWISFDLLTEVDDFQRQKLQALLKRFHPRSPNPPQEFRLPHAAGQWGLPLRTHQLRTPRSMFERGAMAPSLRSASYLPCSVAWPSTSAA